MTESEKRHADHEDDEEHRPSKRERGPLVQLRILLPSAAAGPIIGAKGENLKRLKAQCKSGAHNIIRVADSPNTPERILMVSCHPDDIERIILHIGPDIVKALPPTAYREDELSILIPNDQAGPIIGKSGSNILKMRTDSGAKVRIYKDKLPFSDERIILMQGSQQCIAKCVVVLADLLMQFPCMYQYTQYCPQSERSDLDCGGYAHIGEFAHSGDSMPMETASMGTYNSSHADLRQNMGRNNIPSSQLQPSWMAPQPPQQQQQQDPTTVQLNQLQQQILQLQQQIQPQSQPFNNSQYNQSNYSQATSYPPPPAPCRQASQQPRIKNNPELEIKKTITIPEEFTSSLIGPKGSNIMSLRKKAKAKIFIVNDKADDEPRCIELSGNVRGVQHAEQLIQTAMEDIERQRGSYLLSPRETEDTTRIWTICTSVSGAIIGEKGAKISVIRQHSGSQVHIEKEDDTSSTLTLKGTLQNIKIAEDLVIDAMDPTEAFTETMDYNTSRGRSMSSQGNDGYNAQNSFSSTFDNSGYTPFSAEARSADAKYAEFQSSISNTNSFSSYYDKTSAPFTTVSSNEGSLGATVKVIQYDDKHTGAIIGAKGAHIGSLRQQSACDIQIDTKEKPVNGQRSCSITGTAANVLYAESLIESTITKSLLGRT